MRQRFRPLRARAMARRPGEEGRITLGPRERRLLGWIVAIVLVIGIAIVVGILGGNGDGAPVDPGQSASPSAGTSLPITFGTALDATTGEVPTDAQVDRFTTEDTFAYSIQASEGRTVPATVYVEVERIGGGAAEVVQSATRDGEQAVPPGRPTIGFTVPAARLLAVFGPGEYRMRIFVDPEDPPLAEGSFSLVGEVAPPSVTPSAAP
jgi:hypothetical protein